MILGRNIALLALLATFTVSAVTAAPSTVPDLLRLAEAGVGEPVLLSLARHQGIDGPVGPDEVLAMSDAGFSDALMSEVIRAAASAGSREAAPMVEPGRVVYEERDGAVVAKARGTEDAAPAPSPPPAPTPQVIVVQAPPAPIEPAAPVPAASAAPELNAYPAGAVHGWAGSTVFLPARFGGNPSAFGRTIVDFDASPGAGPWAPGGHWAPSSPLSIRPAPRTTLIRTSRGLLRVPN